MYSRTTNENGSLNSRCLYCFHTVASDVRRSMSLIASRPDISARRKLWRNCSHAGTHWRYRRSLSDLPFGGRCGRRLRWWRMRVSILNLLVKIFVGMLVEIAGLVELRLGLVLLAHRAVEPARRQWTLTSSGISFSASSSSRSASSLWPDSESTMPRSRCARDKVGSSLMDAFEQRLACIRSVHLDVGIGRDRASIARGWGRWRARPEIRLPPRDIASASRAGSRGRSARSAPLGLP